MLPGKVLMDIPVKEKIIAPQSKLEIINMVSFLVF